MPHAKQTAKAVLTARPAEQTEPKTIPKPGIYPLGLGQKRDGWLVLPKSVSSAPLPLIVMLHGAGGDGENMLQLLQHGQQQPDCVLLLPDARKHTWDFLVEDFGPDVKFIDQALQQTFNTCAVDPSKVALAGFSDGASYALTLGLANGGLFTHVIAFSPGFMRPPRLEGTPKVFVSHGTRDEVLPVARCSRRIIPQLEDWSFDFVYHEFDGPHTVPAPILAEAMRWFLGPETAATNP